MASGGSTLREITAFSLDLKQVQHLAGANAVPMGVLVHGPCSGESIHTPEVVAKAGWPPTLSTRRMWIPYM